MPKKHLTEAIQIYEYLQAHQNPNDERFDLEEDALIPCGNGMDVTTVYTLDEIEDCQKL